MNEQQHAEVIVVAWAST